MRGREQAARLLAREQPDVVLAAAPAAGVGDLGAGPGELGAGAGEHDGAALGPVRVDALGGQHPPDLVDGGPHGGVLGERALAVGDRPTVAASLSSEAGNSAEHQPPLRPDAPKPAISASSTTIRSVGSASAR